MVRDQATLRMSHTDLEQRRGPGPPASSTATIAELNMQVLQRHQAEACRGERQTLQRLLRSSDHERQLIADEIHDGLTQLLAAALMQLEGARQLQDDEAAAAAAAAGLDLLRQGLAEARRRIDGVAACRSRRGLGGVGDRAPRPESSRERGPDRVPQLFTPRACAVPASPGETRCTAVAEEGLTNARRHSGSQTIRATLSHGDRCVRIRDSRFGRRLPARRRGRGELRPGRHSPT